MKYLLDLDQLAVDGKITADECARLKGFSQKGTGSLGARVLFVFGAVAVAAAGFLFLPNELRKMLMEFAEKLFGTPNGQLVLIVLLGIAGFMADSGFLASLAALALFGFIGSAPSYFHAEYVLSVPSPLTTVIVFGALGGLGLWVTESKRVPQRYERVVVILARNSLFYCNLGFWVGSLWGAGRGERFSNPPTISPELFAVVWAVVLLAAVVLAVQLNRRAMLNMVATFAGIHFYTQFYEYLSATPGTLLVGGIILIACSWGLVRLNRMMNHRRVGQLQLKKQG